MGLGPGALRLELLGFVLGFAKKNKQTKKKKKKKKKKKNGFKVVCISPFYICGKLSLSETSSLGQIFKEPQKEFMKLITYHMCSQSQLKHRGNLGFGAASTLDPNPLSLPEAVQAFYYVCS